MISPVLLNKPKGTIRLRTQQQCRPLAERSEIPAATGKLSLLLRSVRKTRCLRICPFETAAGM
jgi:hypothetical protein